MTNDRQTPSSNCPESHNLIPPEKIPVCFEVQVLAFPMAKRKAIPMRLWIVTMTTSTPPTKRDFFWNRSMKTTKSNLNHWNAKKMKTRSWSLIIEEPERPWTKDGWTERGADEKRLGYAQSFPRCSLEHFYISVTNYVKKKKSELMRKRKTRWKSTDLREN